MLRLILSCYVVSKGDLVALRKLPGRCFVVAEVLWGLMHYYVAATVSGCLLIQVKMST